MNNRLPALGALALALLLTGCATSFKSINREGLTFAPAADSTGLPVQYRFNVLDDSPNPRYAAKARMHGYQFVAVKVTNNQNRPLALNTDVSYHIGNNAVVPTAIRSTLPVVRQRTGAYAFYLLLMLINIQKNELKCDSYDCRMESTFIPVGLILGPAIAIGNMALSSSANDAFAAEFAGNDLYGKVLQPGETAVGYLAFRDAIAAPLAIRPR